MTIEFNEKEQEKKVRDLRAREEENLAEILSHKYNIPYIDLSGVPIDTHALGLIKENVAKETEVAGFDLTGKKLSLAARSPQKDSVQIMVKKLESEGYLVRLFIVSMQSLEKAWSRYSDITFATKTTSGLLDISNDDIENFVKNNKTTEDVKLMIEKVLALKKSHRVTIIVETILAGAISLDASDIHIEPQEKAVRLRMRLDGILVPFIEFDIETYKLLLSRLKLLSGLKLSIVKNAQDGRFSIHIGNIEVEIRTSILPSNYGESIVMRILNPNTIALSLNQLGIHESLMKIIKKQLSKPSGMILNTGPTGSGKTTALYAFLKHIYKPGIKIITIEDPIEYHLPGITQTQVNKQKGYTFLEGLRSALRQDPDVIMVGEIRDKETANVAINAALTGHVVLSTLHTNNAAGTFPRLVDLGVNPKTIGSAVRLSISQRLVRKIRIECKEEIILEGKDEAIARAVVDSLDKKEIVLGAISPTHAWGIKEKCRERVDSGYKGRIGIFEGIIVNDEMESFLKNSPGEREIIEFTKKQNLMTIQEDGMLKVLSGTTNINELRRVIDID